MTTALNPQGQQLGLAAVGLAPGLI
jgi:hypothetical protein